VIKEIYLRDPSDPLYNEGIFEVESEVEILLGQIRMLLFTQPGEVLGRIDFGIDLEREVFSMGISNASIERIVTRAIYEECPDAANYNVKVSVSFVRGTARDICLIDIFIDNTKYMGIVIK